MPDHAVRASFTLRELQRSSEEAQLYGYLRTPHGNDTPRWRMAPTRHLSRDQAARELTALVGGQ